MGETIHTENDTDISVAVGQTKTQQPPRYKVLLMNDDYTPMDFVVHILKIFFSMNEQEAERIMWLIHTKGKAVCGVYPFDIAETKRTQVNNFAQQHENPLMCTMEPE